MSQKTSTVDVKNRLGMLREMHAGQSKTAQAASPSSLPDPSAARGSVKEAQERTQRTRQALVDALSTAPKTAQYVQPLQSQPAQMPWPVQTKTASASVPDPGVGAAQAEMLGAAVMDGMLKRASQYRKVAAETNDVSTNMYKIAQAAARTVDSFFQDSQKTATARSQANAMYKIASASATMLEEMFNQTAAATREPSSEEAMNYLSKVAQDCFNVGVVDSHALLGA
jgi:hypothetical protein